MRLGIVGLPLAGKTTVFNALTGASVPTGLLRGPGNVEVHQRVADVPDPRLDALCELLRPRKVTHAQVTFVDVDGLRIEAEGRGLSGALADHLAAADGLLAVVRAFENAGVPHPLGGVDAGRDLVQIDSELRLHDMVALDRKIERLAEEKQKGSRDRTRIEREQILFQRLQEHLAEARALREARLTAEDEEHLAGFLLLSRKPGLAVVNVAETRAGEDRPAPETSGWPALSFSAKLEMEIAQLPPEEAQGFLEGYGLKEPARRRVLRACYDVLDLQSFFTVNEQEGRAWTLRRGGTALQAAQAVHTDLARGFVRAEVIPWDQLVEVGGLPQARARGLLRLEGKDYAVADGDFVFIRSSH